MRFVRFSLGYLMLFVAVVCVALAGLHGHSRFWHPAIFSLTLSMLVAASFAAWYSDGLERAFFSGFAIVAWSYFAIIYLPAFSEIKKHLLTNEAFDPLIEVIRPDSVERNSQGVVTGVYGGIIDQCRGILHCLAADLLGMAMGAFAAAMAHRRELRRLPHRST